jgi:hypothetical protein
LVCFDLLDEFSDELMYVGGEFNEWVCLGLAWRELVTYRDDLHSTLVEAEEVLFREEGGARVRRSILLRPYLLE